MSWRCLGRVSVGESYGCDSKKPIRQHTSSSSLDTPVFAYTIYGEDTVTRHRAGIQTQEMQRQPYAPPPAHSPPLHHPVPQHVSTVPMMRSPPPPAPSQGGTPYGGYVNPAASGGNQFAPAFGGFMNDQTAQMGFQLGKSAAMAGQEYVEQNVCIR